MSDWKEGIWLTISAILVSVFMMFFISVGTAVREAAKIEQFDTDSVEVLKEYYKIGSYDDVIVRQTDVVNCIYAYKGKYDVYVTSGISPDNYSPVTYAYVWNNSTASGWYDLDSINSILPTSAKYRAALSKDANGAIRCIQFKRIS